MRLADEQRRRRGGLRAGDALGAAVDRVISGHVLRRTPVPAVVLVAAARAALAALAPRKDSTSAPADSTAVSREAGITRPATSAGAADKQFNPLACRRVTRDAVNEELPYDWNPAWCHQRAEHALPGVH